MLHIIIPEDFSLTHIQLSSEVLKSKHNKHDQKRDISQCILNQLVLRYKIERKYIIYKHKIEVVRKYLLL